jgi:hypothetical protein
MLKVHNLLSDAVLEERCSGERKRAPPHKRNHDSHTHEHVQEQTQLRRYQAKYFSPEPQPGKHDRDNNGSRQQTAR